MKILKVILILLIAVMLLLGITYYIILSENYGFRKSEAGNLVSKCVYHLIFPFQSYQPHNKPKPNNASELWKSFFESKKNEYSQYDIFHPDNINVFEQKAETIWYFVQRDYEVKYYIIVASNSNMSYSIIVYHINKKYLFYFSSDDNNYTQTVNKINYQICKSLFINSLCQFKTGKIFAIFDHSKLANISPLSRKNRLFFDFCVSVIYSLSNYIYYCKKPDSIICSELIHPEKISNTCVLFKTIIKSSYKFACIERKKIEFLCN